MEIISLWERKLTIRFNEANPRDSSDGGVMRMDKEPDCPE